MKDSSKPIHKVKVHKVGDSLMLLLNKNERDWINLAKDSSLKAQTEMGKHGRYLSLWSEDEQR